MLLRACMKSLLLPPLPQLLGMVLAWLCWRRWPGLSRVLLAVSFGSLLLLSLPLVGSGLLATLERGYAPPSAAQIASAEAIVILGGGRISDSVEYGGDIVSNYALARLRYGARLQRATGLPVVVSGGVVGSGVTGEESRQPEAQLMADVLVNDLGIEVAWQEGRSRNTAENARYTAELLRQHRIGRVLLVTHGWHMKRAEGVFAAAGLTVIPAPMSLVESDAVSLSDFVASPKALVASYYALHEWLGIWVYWWQGLL